MSGQINSTLRYLSENDGGGVLPQSTGRPLGLFTLRVSGERPRHNLPTDIWGNGTGRALGDKSFWGSLGR